MAIDLTERNLYGVGKGDAYVWGENKALRGLQQQAEQERLRKQKEEIEMADQLAKINYDGVREKDLPTILDKYGELKNTFAKIRGTRDQMERIKLQSQLNQQKAELSRGVGLSKAALQGEGELGKIRLTKPDEISDDFVPKFTALRNKSIFDKDYQTLADDIASTALVPKFDHIGTAKKIADASLYNIPESSVKTQNMPDGGKSYYTESGTKLDKDAVFQNTLLTLNGKEGKGMMREITKLYPNMPLQDAVKAYSDDIYEGMRGKYDKMTRSGASVNKPDNWKEKALFNDALIRGRHKDGIGTSGSEITADPFDRDLYTSPMTNGDIDANGQRKKLFTVKSWVPMNPVTIGVSGIKDAYNVSTGKKQQLDGNNSVEINGMGYYPTEQKGRSQLMVNVVDKDGFEYAIPERYVPIKTRNDKNYKATLKATTDNFKGKSQPATGKTVSASAIKSKVGAKGFEGYSEKELMDYYKSQGYIIK